MAGARAGSRLFQDTLHHGTRNVHRQDDGGIFGLVVLREETAELRNTVPAGRDGLSPGASP
eukprot:8104038-Lingulodinium_polyedra.AAC.1